MGEFRSSLTGLRRLAAPAAAGLLFATACTPFGMQPAGPSPSPPRPPIPAETPTPEAPLDPTPALLIEEGLASWYGPGFHGRRTASGEVFDQNAFTAAHPHLPFGTRLRIVNVSNGRDVVVRVNDRGPFIDDRIIDLSRAAAARIDMIRAGVVPVQVFEMGESEGGGGGEEIP